MSNHENEAISSDEQQQSKHTVTTVVASDHADHPHEQEPKKQQEEEQVEVHVSVQGKKQTIDHEGISKYANFSLDIDDDQNREIKLRIVGNETRGNAFSKYTAYVIKGHDKNGEVNVLRRFSEFHALRTAMVQRWPGCFIPSIPTKNFMHKNDKDETVKRQRYLNDFVIKMTKLPYLYNSQEFQTFLRSKQPDTSNIYSSWSSPTNQSIINKYKECFHDLAGKQIDSTTNNIIGQFYARLKKNGVLLEKLRAQTKTLALAREKFNNSYPVLFSKIIPNYEKLMLNEYTNNRDDCLVYENVEQAKLNEHAAIVKQTTNQNPYWLLYDLIKNEERDGRAFIEALDAREKYESKRHGVQAKIQENEKAIIGLMEGKSNLKSVTSKGTKQEVKYKLEAENEDLKKEKDFLFVLSDIISALIVYIEIPAYQRAKINFYHYTIKKIGGYQLNSVQIQSDVWEDAGKSAKRVQGKSF